MDKPLAGKKIAVLVESQFIPDEIQHYQTYFAGLGADVRVMSRLWDQPSQTFISTVETAGQTPTTLQVSIELGSEDPAQYAAVLMAANYTSVRLRYFEPPGGPADAPAVRFFARAMENPRVIKGALCHGLWILTPVPRLLERRKVICHEVVRADVLNAGAEVVTGPGKVFVDRDLVTAHDWHDVKEYCEAIKDQIVAVDRGGPQQGSGTVPRKRVLVVLSEYGFWGEELVGPLDVFDAAGYGVEFATPRGRRPVALPASKDATFVDPPLGKTVVSAAMAEKTARIDDPNNTRLDNPRSLNDWFPENPYPSDGHYLRKREEYFRLLASRRDEIAARYDALLLVGGSGPLVDMANNYRVKDLIRCFYELDRPIAAECYGVTCLAFTHTSEDDPRPIIWGRHVTGHPRPYDYQEASAFWIQDSRSYFETRFPSIPLQLVLECAVGPEGRFHGNVGKEVSVVVDYPFITGRSTGDSTATGEQLRRVLSDPAYRRYGW